MHVFRHYATHLSYIEKPYLLKEIKRIWIIKRKPKLMYGILIRKYSIVKNNNLKLSHEVPL